MLLCHSTLRSAPPEAARCAMSGLRQQMLPPHWWGNTGPSPGEDRGTAVRGRQQLERHSAATARAGPTLQDRMSEDQR